MYGGEGVISALTFVQSSNPGAVVAWILANVTAHQEYLQMIIAIDGSED